MEKRRIYANELRDGLEHLGVTLKGVRRNPRNLKNEFALKNTNRQLQMTNLEDNRLCDLPSSQIPPVRPTRL